ncbi:MAG: hypothetical protein KBD16_01650 [Candidatus Pacebacteria bacterium]|nr:hypothetical protein [Candidatus Paceibacterota bacterium]
MSISELLSLIAGATTVVVIATYFKQVLKNDSIPNPATWFIWLVVALLNTATYFTVVEKSFFLSMIAIVQSVGFVMFMGYALIRGKFGKVGNIELTSIALALLVGIFWQTTGDAKVSNLLLQVIFLISFYPTILGLVKQQLKEKPFPWFLAVASYALLILAILIDWNSTSAIALAFPIVNILGNGSIGFIALTQKRVVDKTSSTLDSNIFL